MRVELRNISYIHSRGNMKLKHMFYIMHITKRTIAAATI